MKVSNKELVKHLEAADAWMRELHGWLWSRRHTGAGVNLMRAHLCSDLKRGEKLLAKLKGGAK